ncbi:hypothetical protein RDWZM_004309 [Blomia tropicalis]|uniref:Uncharacterized protein n=1 Tax=Blomia tropicalis TaxID=40697 RepID=A0A9Q0MH77_BLOTA|nr:hypothetical protein RDWZM_004309 [Blomia tropicalis]
MAMIVNDRTSEECGVRPSNEYNGHHHPNTCDIGNNNRNRIVDVTGDNQSSSYSSSSSVLTPTLIPVSRPLSSLNGHNRSQHYQLVTPQSVPNLSSITQNQFQSIRAQTINKSFTSNSGSSPIRSSSLGPMSDNVDLVDIVDSNDRSSFCYEINSPKMIQNDANITINSKQPTRQHSKISSRPTLQSSDTIELIDCCSCRSMSINQSPDNCDENIPIKENNDSNQFIIYLLLKKLFSIFSRRRRKNRRKRVPKLVTNQFGESVILNPKGIRRTNSIYSTGRWSSFTNKRTMKLSGNSQIAKFNYLRSNQIDCDECRRMVHQQDVKSRYPLKQFVRRSSGRRNGQSKVDFERFIRHHRHIMSTLNGRRFGVNKMFDQLSSVDRRPNYQFLNQLLYQGVVRNRMSGYRYNLIRPIQLVNVPEEREEIGVWDEYQKHRPIPMENMVRSRRCLLPQNTQTKTCCECEVVVPIRTKCPPPPPPPSTSRPTPVRQSETYNPTNYVNNNQSCARSQCRLVVPQVSPETNCIDCIIERLKHNRSNTNRSKPPTFPNHSFVKCSCCDNQMQRHPATNGKPIFGNRCEFYPAEQFTNRSQFVRMSSRRRKMLYKKFDTDLIITRPNKDSSPDSNDAMVRHESTGVNRQVPINKTKHLYQRTGRRSSLPTSSSDYSSDESSQDLQPCKCCSNSPSSSAQQPRINLSQFVCQPTKMDRARPNGVINDQQSSTNTCFCSACISRHNLTVAKL